MTKSADNILRPDNEYSGLIAKNLFKTHLKKLCRTTSAVSRESLIQYR